MKAHHNYLHTTFYSRFVNNSLKVHFFLSYNHLKGTDTETKCIKKVNGELITYSAIKTLRMSSTVVKTQVSHILNILV